MGTDRNHKISGLDYGIYYSEQEVRNKIIIFASFPFPFPNIPLVQCRGLNGCLYMWWVPLEERNTELGEPCYTASSKQACSLFNGEI